MGIKLLILFVLSLLCLRLDAQPNGSEPDANPIHLSQVKTELSETQIVGVDWWSKLKDGGLTALLQLALSLVGGICALAAHRQLQRTVIAPLNLKEKALELWKNHQFAELENFGQKHPSTLGRAIAFIVKQRASSVADVNSTVADIASREMDQRLQLSYPLGVIATLQPLLGLLGMIFGLIHSFDQVAFAGALGNAALLAGGISEALVTTGLGIALAIPFLALYHFFKHRNTYYSLILEEEISDFITATLMAPSTTRSSVNATPQPLLREPPILSPQPVQP